MKLDKKYVVLEHLTMPDKGLKFWTMNTENNTHSIHGELWYKEIMFTDNTDEAIKECSNIDWHKLPTHEEFEQYYKNNK